MSHINRSLQKEKNCREYFFSCCTHTHTHKRKIKSKKTWKKKDEQVKKKKGCSVVPLWNPAFFILPLHNPLRHTMLPLANLESCCAQNISVDAISVVDARTVCQNTKSYVAQKKNIWMDKIHWCILFKDCVHACDYSSPCSKMQTASNSWLFHSRISAAVRTQALICLCISSTDILYDFSP